MPKPRDIVNIIRWILDVIPSDELHGELRHDLNGIIKSANYTAPEAMFERWAELGVTLAEFHRIHKPLWADEVRRIVQGHGRR